MTTTTRRFAQLLIDARAWDERHQAMCHAQEEWLLENFAFGDDVCRNVTLEDRQAWAVPRVVGGYLYTKCG
jgi:hypothetical protein